ncbi:Proline-rich protein 20E [Sciurus carolinensis]|uniref:Proline-rich protein 20E n=1 Tax=Sciurus carolinensis TaxID=30640 RepID=A0AA41SZE9_SCICA|nr:Proline-rich protein 20E [Sciurus carolinensis]
MAPIRPSKPVAYVTPTRSEAPAPTEPLQPAQRGRPARRGRRGGRGRGSQTQQSVNRWDTDLLRGLAPSVGADQQGELRSYAEPELRLGPEAGQTPAFHLHAASTASEHVLPHHAVHAARPWRRLQDPRPASGYSAVLGQQPPATYPCIVFSPWSSPNLRFMHTSSGTLVFGVPVLFAHVTL